MGPRIWFFDKETRLYIERGVMAYEITPPTADGDAVDSPQGVSVSYDGRSSSW